MAIAPVRAWSQQIPPPESGTSTVHVKLVNGDQIEIRDATTNAPIALARGQKLVEFLDPAVRLTIQLQSQPTGADVILNFRNTSGTPKGLGMINMGILTLGPTVTYQDMRQTCEPVTADISTYVGQNWPYPADMYCPAWVVSNGSYHVGVSLQYPVLVYKHDAMIGLSNPKGNSALGEGGPGWAVNFLLSPIGNEGWQKVQYGAEIQPGEQRTYVMSVRVQPKSGQWIRTLTPYRNYFRSLYGGVRYERNPRPVVAMGFSDTSHLSADNPYGFSPQERPDRRGFTHYASVIKNDLPGWSSVMVWLPGGVYQTHQTLNFPFQFTSTWLQWPIASSTAFDETTGLASIRKTGKDFGLWWGNSTSVALSWDPESYEDFDPDNAEHVKRALLELDTAARSGATTIGLDTFNHVHTPIWKSYGWLEAMRLRYPQMRFVTEPSMCDVMHTLAPTFISAWSNVPGPATEEDLYLVKHPNYIADFLLPGHEMWAAFRYNELTQYFGKVPDAARVTADIKRFSDYGYVAVIQHTVDVKTSVVAAKSWNTTVPADLRVSDAPLPFGPAAAGSTHVALGTGARADRGGGPVAGWRPAKPSVPAAAPSVGSGLGSVAGTRATGSGVKIRVGKASNRAPTEGPAVSAANGGTAVPAAVEPVRAARVERGRSGAFRVSTPNKPISGTIRRARELMFGPPAPRVGGPPMSAQEEWEAFWMQSELVVAPVERD